MSNRPTERPRPWLFLSVKAPPSGEEILLVEALRRIGARAVEREGARYLALLPPPRDPEATVRDAEAVIQASTSLHDPRVSWRWRSYEGWAAEWSSALAPRRVGERIVVAPRGREVRARGDDLVIRLVPGLGFGTAEHATTRGCLRLLERVLSSGDRVADVGAGSGILAVAASLLGATRVLALEMDPHACAAARENVRENGVEERVEIREAEVGPDNPLRDHGFEGITANLQADVLVRLLPGLSRALVTGGWLIASGISRAERAEVLGAARAVILDRELEELEEGWWTACFRRQERSPEP